MSATWTLVGAAAAGAWDADARVRFRWWYRTLREALASGMGLLVKERGGADAGRVLFVGRDGRRLR